MEKMNGAEAVVRMLQLNGVKHIFGLCGDTSLPFYDALQRLDHGMDHVLTRDERSAGYMADAYARVTGKVGVCEGPSGGGATYLLPGLVEANESSIAVLGITSDVSVGSRGKYPLTELDQESLYRPLTKWNTRIDRSDQIPGAVRTAFRAMTTGRPGSAHLCLPYDVQQHPVNPEDVWAQAGHDRFPAMRSGPDPQAVEQAAERLVRSRAPVFICGGGVVIAGACDVLAKLATSLNAPVCTTVSGQGSLADTHPLNAGVVGSNGGILATREVISGADLIIFIGCRAGSTTTEHWRFPNRSVPIIHIDSDPLAIGANYRTDVALVGDALLSLKDLDVQVQARITYRPSDAANGTAIVKKAKAAKRAAFAPLAASLDMPIKPERVVDALNRLLPQDAVVVADPGTPCPYFSAYFETHRAGRQFITNRAHGALGYSMAAGIGAAIGRPNAKIVSVMGDGSFGFTVGEMETIVRRKVPLLMVVFSNSVYGWIKASQKAGYNERYFSVDFSRTNHARIAEAYGIKAWTVEDPSKLDEIFRLAIAHDGPALVDVISQPLQDTAAPVSQWMG
jgi:acetolactate synthase-1/2/3 large subunit